MPRVPGSSGSRFEVLGHLGSGGMGDVSLARVVGDASGQQVALKRIRADRRDHPELVAQFEREMALGAALSHPHIVRVVAYGSDAQGPFLALEYVPGHSAHRLLKALAERGRQLPLEAGLCIVRDVAEALHYAHHFRGAKGGAGILHRDVSPDNVLVALDGHTRLMDFGLAKAADVTATTGGVIRGKHGYLAPELFEGHPADALTDLFAFGVTAYRVLCGVLPFHGTTEAELLHAVLHAERPAPRALRPQVPEALSALLVGLVDRRRERRPQELTALLSWCAQHVDPKGRAALGGVLREVLPPPGVVEPAAPGRVSTRPLIGKPRRARWPLALAALVTLVALGATVALRTEQGAPDAVAVRAAPAPAPVAVAPVSPAPAVEAPVAPAPERRPASRHEPARRSATARPMGAAPAERGTLRLLVNPWAEVRVDGEVLGPTPLPPIALSPGRHTVVLSNDSLSARRTLQVSIHPGDETVLRVDLEQH